MTFKALFPYLAVMHIKGQTNGIKRGKNSFDTEFHGVNMDARHIATLSILRTYSSLWAIPPIQKLLQTNLSEKDWMSRSSYKLRWI